MSHDYTPSFLHALWDVEGDNTYLEIIHEGRGAETRGATKRRYVSSIL